jgi:2-polyprenyl-3-methyl-5-hydroxy-6-metoxy-1,4-benzoquinol methylase
MQAMRPSSILDVGCGEGVVTQRIARLARVTTVGVDLGDQIMRAEWRHRAGGLLTFEAGSAYDLPFDDGSFDCVCALEVLEHLERPQDALAEMARVAARTLLLSVPREPAWRIAHMLAGRDVRDLGNTPGHINHWSARAFKRFVSEHGTVTQVVRPFPWTVVTVSRV